MYARQNHLNEISIHLTYYHLDSHEEKTFERQYVLSELESFFNELVITYLNWFRKVYAWQSRRDQLIQQLNFPYQEYRLV